MLGCGQNHIDLCYESSKVILCYCDCDQKQPGRNGDDGGLTDSIDDDDFLHPAADLSASSSTADVFESEAEAGEGERQAKMAAVKDFLSLAVELSFPDNSALERETMRQRLAKLQDTLLVCRS